LSLDFVVFFSLVELLIIAVLTFFSLLFSHFVAAVNLYVNGMWWSQSTRWELDLMPSAQMAH